MTIANPKFHIICGACGCSTMIEFSGSTLYCRNCGFVVDLSEVIPERAANNKGPVQQPITQQGRSEDSTKICPNCSLEGRRKYDFNGGYCCVCGLYY